MKSKNKLVIFQDNKIRRIWHNEGRYFSVIDVVQVATESNNPRNYWSMLKKREENFERNLGKPIISKENYLPKKKDSKIIKKFLS